MPGNLSHARDKSPSGRACACSIVSRLPYAAPLALIAALLVSYYISRDWYLRVVLAPIEREYQVVELVTFAAALGGSILTLFAAFRYWKAGNRVAALVAGIIGLAAFFFAGEEISWGQTYIGWQTPDSYRSVSRETNLHNGDLGIRALANLFVLAAFVGLPAAWGLRKRFNWKLPESLAAAVPEPAVVFAIIVAFVWRWFKSVYQLAAPDWESQGEAGFYLGFVEQINEHKEMLVAVGLFMYGCYRIRSLRMRAATQPVVSPVSAEAAND